MARRAAVLVALAAAPSASLVAPVAPLSTSQRQRTVVQESFGFDFAEDQAENTDLTILGERRLKEEFIRSYKPTATVLEGKPYPVFQEVQEKKLLSGTVNSGLLRALDDLGLGLGDVEKLLPVIDKAGVLGLVRKNLPLAIIATGYILIEPAPFLLPVLGALLAVPSGIWTAVAASPPPRRSTSRPSRPSTILGLWRCCWRRCCSSRARCRWSRRRSAPRPRAAGVDTGRVISTGWSVASSRARGGVRRARGTTRPSASTGPVLRRPSRPARRMAALTACAASSWSSK